MSFKKLAKRVIPPMLWSRLRQIKQRRRLAAFDRRVVKHIYGGTPLQIMIADGLGEGWYDHDWNELQEIRMLREHQMRAGARVFDLGAHQGVVAIMLANAVGPSGTVVAVEATSHNFEIAGINKELNQVQNLRLIHAAAAENAGQISFNQGLNGQVDENSGTWGCVTIPAVTVDGLAQEFGAPQALFIDVEGFECHVLRGAESTMKTRPDCFIEVHVGEGLEKFGGSADAVLSFFPDSDYERFVWSEALPQRVPVDRAGDLLRSRFFLLALSRNRGDNPT